MRLSHNPTARCTAGERYECEVPDTLDLADRMGLAINALTNAWIPDEKWALHFCTDFTRRTPVLYPSHLVDAYLNIPPKFIEALVLCRLASGSDYNLAVNANVVRAQLSFLGDDGLTYCPTDTLEQFAEPRVFSEVWGEGRTLHRVIGEIPYKLALRGSNVTSIEPEGSAYPLYEDQPSGRLVRKTRFIPSAGPIEW